MRAPQEELPRLTAHFSPRALGEILPGNELRHVKLAVGNSNTIMASGSKIDLHLAVREVALNLYDASGDSAWVEHPNGSFDIMTMQIDELFKDTDM